MKWVDLTSPRLNGISRDTICVLPLGAIEQHGPHLPVSTDQVIADGLAEQLDYACDGLLLIMPPLPATYSEHHMAFPGTLTLDHETLANVIILMVSSAMRHGFYRFFLLNAHGGNVAVGGVITQRLNVVEPRAEVVFGTWFQMAGERLRHLVEGEYPAVGHACEFETSLLLALRPELVDVEAICDDGVAPESPLLNFDLLTGPPTTRSVPFERITTNGVWGKPSLATAAKGRDILTIAIDTIRQLLVAHWPMAPGLSESNSPQKDGHSHEMTAGAGLALSREQL